MAGRTIDIKDLSKKELIEELDKLDIEKFRAGQILDWVYKKYVYNFDKMTNLPPALRDSLKEKFYISDLKLLKEQVSKDGARKFLFELEDAETIESVFIPSKNTNTVCVSSQVGCKFACKFCASGKGGFVRNLRPAEMVNQVLYVKTPHPNPLPKGEREYNFSLSPEGGEGRGEGVTNVVFMGMGEPLDNYDNVLKAIRILNAPYGLAIGQRKITISTCGIAPGIKKLMEEDLQIELSVSLHSPDDKARSTIMAVNKRYPVRELMAALKEYIRRTNRQVTFEYLLIKGVNDSVKDAQGLAALLKGMLAKVNLILFNAPHPSPLPKGERESNFSLSPEGGEGRGEGEYMAPDAKVIRGFKNTLDENNIMSTVRVSRGRDIEAACGQLRSKKV